MVRHKISYNGNVILHLFELFRNFSLHGLFRNLLYADVVYIRSVRLIYYRGDYILIYKFRQNSQFHNLRISEFSRKFNNFHNFKEHTIRKNRHSGYLESTVIHPRVWNRLRYAVRTDLARTRISRWSTRTRTIIRIPRRWRNLPCQSWRRSGRRSSLRSPRPT